MRLGSTIVQVNDRPVESKQAVVAAIQAAAICSSAEAMSSMS